jgi:hypothetical protein
MAGGPTLKQLAQVLQPLREKCLCRAKNCAYCILKGGDNTGCENCFMPVLEDAKCLFCHDK